MIFSFSDGDYDYKIEVFCPHCGSTDVVVEVVDGFFHFSSCNRCGHRIHKLMQQDSLE